MARKLEGFMKACCSDLMLAYNKAWSLPDVTTHRQAVATAISLPASRYWIAPSEAARNISRLEKGKEPNISPNTNKYKALMGVYEEYKKLRATKFKTESTAFVTSFACLQKAPRFYISEARALRIIKKIRSGKYSLL